MKKTFKRIFSVLMVMAMLLTSAPMSGFSDVILSEWLGIKAFATSANKCGDNLYWSFDSATGELAIEGSGEMYNYERDYQPWFDYIDEITSVVLPESLTSIGANAFADLEHITSIEIPESVTSIGDYAFIGDMYIESVFIPENVKYIGECAFSSCLMLENYIVDENNDYFVNDDRGVLYNKDKTVLVHYPARLKMVEEDNVQEDYVIPSTVEKIGDFAFYACYNLASVTIPDSVTYIGKFAFIECILLTEINIPDGITHISEYAFGHCIGLDSIDIPDGVVEIGGFAFASCTGLTSVVIPENVVTIGNEAFYNCEGLESVEIGNSVTAIGSSAFEDCTGLTSVTIPDSVTTIGDSAFYGCDSLTSVTIGNGVTTIGDSAFYGCDNLTSVTIGNSVTTIGDYAFDNCDSLTSVTIPNSVTTIGDYAFCECNSLTSVTIGNSVTTLGYDPFCWCSGLTSITVDADNQYYSSDSYGVLYNKNKTELIQYPIGNERTSFTIPDSVTTIGDGAFHDCDSLTSVTIPDSVTTIGSDAFAYCFGLASVTMGNSVTTIGDYAFGWCDGLADVYYNGTQSQWNEIHIVGNDYLETATIHFKEVADSGKCGDNLTWEYCSDGTLIITGTGEMGDYDYSYPLPPWSDYSDSIKSVIIGNNVTSVGVWAFYGCSAITSVKIGKSISSIGDFAFDSCTGITHFIVDGDNQSYSNDSYGVLYNKNKTELIKYSIGDERTSFVIPDTVTTIGGYAFRDCTNITSVTIPDSVITVGDHAFIDCENLTGVTIGNNVTSIENEAFGGCKSLNNIIIPNSVTSIGIGAFENCRSFTSIVIPDGVKDVAFGTFTGCTSLTQVTIPASVSDIADSAFYYCTSLNDVHYGGTELLWNEISIGSDNEYLENATFHFKEVADSGKCGDNLTWEYCSDGTLVITGTGAMYDYEAANRPWESYVNNIESIIIGNGAATIGDKAFNSCESLIRVTLPDSITIIGDYAFYSCRTLTDITIPGSVTTIGAWAFCGCESLTSITIPNSITIIGDDAFCGCTSLTSATIPDSVTTIGNNLFFGCISLTSITVDTDNQYYSSDSYGVLYNKNKTELIQYPAGNERISFIIPDSVTTIGGYAFICFTSLTSVTIPNSVTTIEDYAFYLCTTLTDVYYSGTQERWNNISIGSNNNKLLNATIHFSADEHNYTYEITKEPDCENTGIRTYTCSHCDDTYTETIPALGHSFNHVVVESTCKVAGMEYDLCTVCGETANTTNLPLADHSWNEGDITKQPDCGNTGIKTYTCSVCGDTYTETLPIIGEHSHTGKVTTNATCLKAGVMTYTCKCGDSYTEAIPATGHNYKSEYIEKTEFEEGYTLFTCENCGAQYIVLDPPQEITDFVAFGGINCINLSWGKAAEASVSGYKIYRKDPGSDEFKVIKTITSRATLSYIDKDVETEKEYVYKISAFNTDCEGALSQPVAATALVDNIAPRVTSFSVKNYSIISGKKLITVYAEDNIGVTSYAFYCSTDAGETWIELGKLTNGATFTFDTTQFADGDIRFKAVAYDIIGNESPALIYEYRIDNTGPDKVMNVQAASVLANKITLSWDDVNANDFHHFILQKKVGDEFVNVSTNVSTKGYNVLNLTPDTEYVFRVAAVDSLGNIGEYSDEISVVTLPDTSVPVISKQQSGSGAFSSSYTYKATASDDCGIEKITIQVSADEVTWNDVYTYTYTTHKTSISFSYTLNLESYPEGFLYIRAIVTDFAGNVSNTSSTAPSIEIVVDRTGPAMPSNVSASGRSGYIYVSWDADATGDVMKYCVYRSNSYFGTYSEVYATSSYSNYNDSNVNYGEIYYYKVIAYDAAGNESEFSSVVQAEMMTDTDAPTVSSVSPSDNATIGPNYYTVSVSAKDNNRLDTVSIEYKINDGDYSVLKSVSDVNVNSYILRAAIPIKNLSSGDKVYIRAKASGYAYLESEATEVVYTVDKTAPGVENLSVTDDDENCIITWNDTGDSDINGFKVYSSKDGKSYTRLANRAASSDGSYICEIDLSNFTNGEYTFRVDAFDIYENQSSSYVSYIFDHVIDTTPDVGGEDEEEEISNQPPSAEINVPSTMEVGVAEYFDASDSFDNDGSIVEYLWDFGDGTTSTKMKNTKTYTQEGTYEVKLTVTDNEGLQDSITKTVTVKEKTLIGKLVVTVLDTDGNRVPYTSVYIDVGTDEQYKVISDSNGQAVFYAEAGIHCVGVFEFICGSDNNYLPVRMDATVLAGETTNVTIKAQKGDVVTGEFEVNRMTPEEIVAAGIDVTDEANKIYYKGTVHMVFKEHPVTVTYYKDDTGRVVGQTISDSTIGGRYIKPVVVSSSKKTVEPDDSDEPSVPDEPSVETEEKGDTILLLDVPIGASILKDFFDVKLHIMNHADEEYSLDNCDISLSVPNGMTLMTTVNDMYSASSDVHIDSIPGGESRTISWVLRGDKAGEYDLFADFTSTLAIFNEEVNAIFKTDEPIKVRGTDAFEVVVQTPNYIFVDNPDDMTVPTSSYTYYENAYMNVGIKNVSNEDLYYADVFAGAGSSVPAKFVETETGVTVSQDLPITNTARRLESNGNFTELELTNESLKVLKPGETLFRYYKIGVKSGEFAEELPYYSLERFFVTSTGISDVKVTTEVDNEIFYDYYIRKSSNGDPTFIYSAFGDSTTKKETNRKISSGYSDSFFNNDATEFKLSIATTTLKLVMSGFSNAAYAGFYEYDLPQNNLCRATNIMHSYAQMGFTDDEYVDYNDALSSSEDKAAFSMAKKYIVGEDGEIDTVVALVVRGGGYGAEWASNFKVGSSGFHTGFKSAADGVYSGINSYVSKLKSQGKIKGDLNLWISGYSRGAATANITAHMLNSTGSVGGVAFKKTDAFVYTFATPQGTVEHPGASADPNIFNIVNPADFVPKVAMEGWGFGRYGKTLTLGANLFSESTSEIADELNYNGNSFELRASGISTTDTIADLLSKLDREFYAEYFEPSVVNGLSQAFSDLGGTLGAGAKLALIDFVNSPAFKDLLKKSMTKIIKDDMKDGMKDAVDTAVNGLTGGLSGTIQKAFKITVTSYKILSTILKLLNDYQQYYEIMDEVAEECDLSDEEKEYYVAKFKPDVLPLNGFKFSDINTILTNHIPELYLASLTSMSSFGGIDNFPGYKTVSYSVSKNTDFTVEDCNGNLKVRIEDGVMTFNSIAAEFSDGKITMIFPANERYFVKLSSGGMFITDSYEEQLADTAETISVYINEYDSSGELVREIRFDDILLEDGVEYSQTISDELLNQEDGYEITSENGEVIESAYDTSNSKSEPHTITVVNGSSYSETAVVGEEIIIAADDSYDNQFVKWVSLTDGVVLNDATADFTSIVMPDSDVVLYAVLESNIDATVISGEAVNGGSATGYGNFTVGDTATLVVTDDESSEFVGWYIDGRLVSEQREYSFVVSGDTVVDAYFRKISGGDEKLQILNNQLELKVDMSEKLVLSISENHPDYSSITWESSDNSVVTVDENGIITAVDAGTATVTAKNAEGETAVCNITVTYSKDKVNFEANPESTCVIKGSYIYGLKTNMTVSEFKTQYVNFIGVTVEVTAAVTGRYIGTGSTVTVTYPNGTEEIYTIVIFGDYDGNGQVNVTDVSGFSSYFTASTALSAAQKKAMNLDGDTRNRITTTDLGVLRSALSNGTVINQVNPAK